MVRRRFMRPLAVVLAITVILWLMPSAHSISPFTITLTPNIGATGTPVTIAGSRPAIGAPSLDHSCQLSSVPGGLISSPTCTVTQAGSGSFTVSGSFKVASGASPGPYTVTVTVTVSLTPYASASASFTTVTTGECARLSAHACVVLVQGGYRDSPRATLADSTD
jgi:hypothetical protein